jgi:hypothetical protein
MSQQLRARDGSGLEPAFEDQVEVRIGDTGRIEVQIRRQDGQFGAEGAISGKEVLLAQQVSPRDIGEPMTGFDQGRFQAARRGHGYLSSFALRPKRAGSALERC